MYRYSVYRMRQLVWSPALVVMTTSRRSSQYFMGFQFASEWSLRRRCWRGSVCTTQRHVTWLTDLCVPAASTDGRRQSRSAVSGALLVPWTRTFTGQPSFAAYGLKTCNQLPTALRSPELSLASFKRQLKTHLSVPALDSAGCSCGCRVPSSCVVVTVQRVRRRLQMSRLNSTRKCDSDGHHDEISSGSALDWITGQI